MGLRGEAAIVGYVELPPERLNKASPAPFVLEQWAELAAAALDDAGLPASVVNGIAASHLAESQIFVPSTIAEYLGVPARFAELVDLGGASAAAMVWRAAAAVELGKAMGARVVAAASTNEKVEFALELGADNGLIYPSGPMDKAAQKALSGEFKLATGRDGAARDGPD